MWEQRYGFPEPERTAVRLPPLQRRRRRGAAPRGVATGGSGCRSRPRSTACASTRRRCRAAVDLRGGRVDRRDGAAAAAAQADADRAVAGDRARDARARRRRRSCSRRSRRSGTTGGSSTATGGIARQADAATVFADFDERARASPGGAGRDPDRPRRRDRQRVGGHRRRARATRRACSRGSTRAQERRARTTARRFEAIWTVHPRAVRRAAEVAARLAGQVDPEYGGELEELLRRPAAGDGDAGARADRADQPRDRVHGRPAASARSARPSTARPAATSPSPGGDEREAVGAEHRVS